MHPELKKKLRENPYQARWRIAGLAAEAAESRGRARELILYSRALEEIIVAAGLCPVTLRLMVKALADRNEVEQQKLVA